jgi:hypothetical protein
MMSEDNELAVLWFLSLLVNSSVMEFHNFLHSFHFNALPICSQASDKILYNNCSKLK